MFAKFALFMISLRKMNIRTVPGDDICFCWGKDFSCLRRLSIRLKGICYFDQLISNFLMFEKIIFHKDCWLITSCNCNCCLWLVFRRCQQRTLHLSPSYFSHKYLLISSLSCLSSARKHFPYLTKLWITPSSNQSQRKQQQPLIHSADTP